jgi:hypothetical protein
MQGKTENNYEIFGGRPAVRCPRKNPGLDLNGEVDGKAYTGSIWLWIGTGAGLL